MNGDVHSTRQDSEAAENDPGGESERLTQGQWPRYLGVTFRSKARTGAATR
jgi:hypothetical protein